MTQTAIGLNKNASDYQPQANFRNIIFEDVHHEAFVHLDSPNLEWATIERCGEFACTGPNNVLLSFKNAISIGSLMELHIPSNF